MCDALKAETGISVLHHVEELIELLLHTLIDNELQLKHYLLWSFGFESACFTGTELCDTPFH